MHIEMCVSPIAETIDQTIRILKLRTISDLRKETSVERVCMGVVVLSDGSSISPYAGSFAASFVL